MSFNSGKKYNPRITTWISLYDKRFILESYELRVYMLPFAAPKIVGHKFHDVLVCLN